MQQWQRCKIDLPVYYRLILFKTILNNNDDFKYHVRFRLYLTPAEYPLYSCYASSKSISHDKYNKLKLTMAY